MFARSLVRRKTCLVGRKREQGPGANIDRSTGRQYAAQVIQKTYGMDFCIGLKATSVRVCRAAAINLMWQLVSK
jgi:hypothetical protein